MNSLSEDFLALKSVSLLTKVCNLVPEVMWGSIHYSLFDVLGHETIKNDTNTSTGFCQL